MFAEVVAYTMKQTLAAELSALISNPSASLAGNQAANAQMMADIIRSTIYQGTAFSPLLPTPVSPVAAQQADTDAFCAEGRSFRRYVQTHNGSTSGSGGSPASWTWSTLGIGKHCPSENCNAWGFQATGVGNYLDVIINASSINSLTDGTKLSHRFVVVFYAQGPLLPDRGVGRLRCVRGCTCASVLLQGATPTSIGASASELHLLPGAADCRLRVSIDASTPVTSEGGGSKFFVQGVAVVPFVPLYPRSIIDNLVFNHTSKLRW